MKSRSLSPEKIREMARAHLKESEEKALQPFGGRGPQALVPKDEGEAVELQFGVFDKALTDAVFIVNTNGDEDDGEEMKLLCETLGMTVADIHYLPQHKSQKPAPATYLGSGTLEKLKERMQRLGAQALVIDTKLSPVQVRNMEDLLKIPVLDREGVILEIFHHHAKSRLAKLQVELARLKYLQPRLSGLWMGLSRQRGARGGLGGRGLGESRLELDRRVVKNRINVLAKKLKEAEKSFRTQSARRSALPRVALVGYTNAGKSTLMRLLTKCEVETEDKLFSTLDTTVRPLQPPTNPKVLLSDTVGFVKNLPHDLVASFKSTLQEALESQLIIHVLDASHLNWREQFLTTEAVLEEVGAAELPKLLVLNKIDRMGNVVRLREAEVKRFLRDYPKYEKVIAISALDKQFVPLIRNNLIEILGVDNPEWSLAKQAQ